MTGRVVMFTGPTGAGKTTVAEAWATSRGPRTAFFDHDHVRFLLRAGYVSRSAAHADPSLRGEADDQWLLAARVCEAMAAEYAASDVDVALAAFRPPGEWMGCWDRLDRMDPLVVVLLPRIETALARDERRTGRAHTGEGSIRRAYTWDWSSWRGHPGAVVIDNDSEDVEAAVLLVERHVARVRRGGAGSARGGGAHDDDPAM